MPAVAVVSGCASVAAWQAKIALRPTLQKPDAALPTFTGSVLSARDLPHAAPLEGSVHTWWLPQSNHAQGSTPTLLYCHGTLHHLWRNAEKIQAWVNAGFSVLALDYRGWGWSSATEVSEASILQDCLLAWASMQALQPNPALRAIFGHSMGGAAAVNLASTLPASDYRAMVLESTFDRINHVASEAGALEKLLSSVSLLEFDSIKKIRNLQAPVWCMHGTSDTTVPWILGRRLYEASPSPEKVWRVIEGGLHSSLHVQSPMLYQEAMQWFRRIPAL